MEHYLMRETLEEMRRMYAEQSEQQRVILRAQGKALRDAHKAIDELQDTVVALTRELESEAARYNNLKTQYDRLLGTMTTPVTGPTITSRSTVPLWVATGPNSAGAQEAVRIDSGGSVGWGSATPSTPLNIK